MPHYHHPCEAAGRGLLPKLELTGVSCLTLYCAEMKGIIFLRILSHCHLTTKRALCAAVVSEPLRKPVLLSVDKVPSEVPGTRGRSRFFKLPLVPLLSFPEVDACSCSSHSP